MKKKRNLIIKICSALLLCFTFIISFTCKSYAWYVNQDGNLQSSNLIDESSLTFNQNTISGSYSQYRSFTGFNIYLTSGTYSFNSNAFNDNFYVAVVGNTTQANYSSSVAFDSDYHSLPFTFTINQNLYCGLYFKKVISGYDQTFNASILSTYHYMLNSGSTILDYEPYGAIYYSQINYTNNYNTGFENGINSITSMFRQCSGVEQTINNVTTTFNSDVSNSAFENWFNQSNGTICSFRNGSIVINYAQIKVQNNLDYGFSYGLKFYFNTFVPNTLHYDYYSFYSNNPCNIYVYCDGYFFFNSDGELFIDNPTGYNIESVYFYVSSANPGPLEWYLTTVDDTSSAYSSGYSQGEQVGYQNGYDNGYSNGVSDGSISGFNEGYEQGSNQQNLGRKLFWTIASTPFESFKTIWDVDVLGLNISGIILGILMALLVLYLIKKIWK